jgi:cyanophycinase
MRAGSFPEMDYGCFCLRLPGDPKKYSDMIPKGRLCIIGGHEEKDEKGESLSIIQREKRITHFEILGTLVSRIPHTHHAIEIIAAASAIPQEMEELYIAAYKAEGFKEVGVIRIHETKDSSDPALIKRVQLAHAVFFTGGDQNRLTDCLNGTPLLEAIHHKYLHDSHFILAGTSAGAMSMPELILKKGILEEALLKNDVEIGPGFGMIGQVLIDTHFIKRGRFSRLALAVTTHPACLGIGLGEDTALLISGGNEAECLGSGMVILIDGSSICACNLKQVDEYTPVVVENLKVHILAEGSRYRIKEKEFILPG